MRQRMRQRSPCCHYTHTHTRTHGATATGPPLPRDCHVPMASVPSAATDDSCTEASHKYMSELRAIRQIRADVPVEPTDVARPEMNPAMLGILVYQEPPDPSNPPVRLDPLTGRVMLDVRLSLFCSKVFMEALKAVFSEPPAVTDVALTVKVYQRDIPAALGVLPQVCGAALRRLDIMVRITQSPDGHYPYSAAMCVADVLVSWLPACTGLQHLVLQNYLNAVDAPRTCAAVATCGWLLGLEFMGTVQGGVRTAAAFCGMLRKTNKLRRLNAHRIELPYVGSPADLVAYPEGALVSFMAGDTACSLACAIPEHGVLGAIAALPDLEDVDVPFFFDRRGIAPGLAQILRKCPRLWRLNAAPPTGGRMDGASEALDELVAAFSGHDTLRVLHIPQLSDAPDSIRCVLGALITNTQLEDVDVSWNGSLSTAYAELPQLLEQNRTLRRLYMNHVEFSSPDAPYRARLADAVSYTTKIGNALAKNTALTDLHLEACLSLAEPIVPLLRAFLTNHVLLRLFCAPLHVARLSDEESKMLHDTILSSLKHHAVESRTISFSPTTRVLAYPLKRHVRYFQPHVHLLVRTRILFQEGRAHTAAGANAVFVWTCESAPLWVVVHVCMLLSTAIVW